MQWIRTERESSLFKVIENIDALPFIPESSVEFGEDNLICLSKHSQCCLKLRFLFVCTGNSFFQRHYGTWIFQYLNLRSNKDLLGTALASIINRCVFRSLIWIQFFLFGIWFVFSSVPDTMVFLIELIMSLRYQANSLIGTLKPRLYLIFNNIQVNSRWVWFPPPFWNTTFSKYLRDYFCCCHLRLGI